LTAPLPGNILKDFDQVLNTQKEYIKLRDLKLSDIFYFWLRNYTVTNGFDSLKTLKHKCKFEADFDFKSYDKHHAHFRDENSFALLQTPTESCLGKRISNEQQAKYLSHPWMYSGVQYIDSEIKKHWKEHDKVYTQRLVAFFSPHNRHYPKDPEFTAEQSKTVLHYLSSAIEKELVVCKKSIFMGETENLIEENLYLKVNYPRKSFYMADDTFETEGSKPVIWKFVNGGKSKVPYYFRQLIEAGIRRGISGLIKHQYYLRRRIGTKYIHESMSEEASVGISGSLQTIFIIVIGSLSVALIVFSVEFVYGNSYFCFLYQTFSQGVKFLRLYSRQLFLLTKNLTKIFRNASGILFVIIVDKVINAGILTRFT
jgi:hypothetical protein